MNFDRKTVKWAVIALVVVVVLIFAVIKYRSRSKFEWPVTNPGSDDTQLTADLQTLQDNYNIAMIAVNAMPAGAAKTQATLDAQKTLTTNINNKVSSYVTNKCPEVTSGTAPAATDTAKTAIWTTYQSDLAKLQQSYYTVVGSATTTTSPTSVQVLAARKADISGATRKYIASICPAFYKTAAADPTTTYKTWTHVASGTAPAVGLLGSDVTSAAVTTWAGYAALTKSTNAELAVLPGAATIGPLAAADWTGFAVGDTVQYTYQTVDPSGVATTSAPVTGVIATLAGTSITITPTVAIPATGIIIPSGTVVAKAFVAGSTNWNKLDASNVPNWKKARDAGPGTYPKPSWAV